MPSELRRFRHPRFAPPGGKWFYTVPETKFYIVVSMSMQELIYKVKNHYRINKLSVPENLAALIQDHMCARLSNGYCTGDPIEGIPPLTFFGVLKGTEKLLQFTNKVGYVSADEAEKRAITCKTCPGNILHFCTSCSGLKQTASEMVGRRKTKIDPYLGACQYMNCVLNGMIHVKRDYLADKLKYGEELPKRCWMKQPTE